MRRISFCSASMNPAPLSGGVSRPSMKQWTQTSFDALALRHFEQRVEMRVHRMHAAVAQQAHQVQAMAARVLHGTAVASGFSKNSPDAIIMSMRVTSI